jgi:condensin-2 complex subunit D3
VKDSVVKQITCLEIDILQGKEMNSSTFAGQKSIQEFQESCNELLQNFRGTNSDLHDELSSTCLIQNSNECISHQEEILFCILSNLEDICDSSISQDSSSRIPLRSLFSPSQVGETGWAVDPRKLSSCLLTLSSHRSRFDDICEGDESEHDGVDIPYTITTLSLSAAKIYLELCKFRGAWSMGWIDVCILRNIEALVRRWGEESRGKKIVTLHLEHRASSKKKKTKKNKSHQLGSDYECHDNDEDEGDNYGHGEATGRDCTIMMGGLQVSRSFTKVLRCPDFWSWSKDVRDAIMDSAVCALGISSSLIISSDVFYANGMDKAKHDGLTFMDDVLEDGDVHDDATDDGHYNSNEYPRKRGLKHSKINLFDTVDFGNHVVNALMSAIENCFRKKLQHVAQQQSQMNQNTNAKVVEKVLEDNLISFPASLDDTNVSLSPCSIAEPTSSYNDDAHEMILTFLRAVYPLLTYQVDLPNGVKGKSSAYHHSSWLVMRLLKGVVKHSNRINSATITPSSVKHIHTEATPAKTPNPSYLCSKLPYSMARKTPRSNSKRFIDGVQIIPPSLKKNAMTPRSIRRETFGNDRDNSLICFHSCSSLLDTFVGLMQRLSIYHGNDKSEMRARTVDFLKRCLGALPSTERNIFFRFAINLCISKVLYHRIFGVDLIGACFLMDYLWIDQADSTRVGPECSLSSIKTRPAGDEMLSTLIGRLNDRAPAVRTRAASVLSSSVSSVHTLDDSQMKCGMINCISNIKLGLLRLLRIRASSDEKASVRRSALLTLVDLLMVDSEAYTKADFAVLKDGCNDVSVAVRKSTIDCILSLLYWNQKNCGHDTQQSLLSLEKSWIDFVLPLIYDTENSVATKVADSFLRIVVDPIVVDFKDEAEDPISSIKRHSAWRILSLLNTTSSPSCAGTGGQRNLVEVLKKSLELMNISDQQNVCVAIFRHVYYNITRELNTLNSGMPGSLSAFFVGAWCLLEGISFFYSISTNKSTTSSWDMRKDIKKSAIGTKFLVDSWNTMYSMGLNRDVAEKSEFVASAKSCLSVISSMSHIMTKDEAKHLLQALLSSHLKFNLGIPLIGPSVSAMVRISVRLNNEHDVASGEEYCKDWILECLGQCENALNNFFRNEYSPTEPIELGLYTVGELMLVGFTSGSEENHVQNVLKNNSKKNECAVHDMQVKPTQNLLRLVQSLLLPNLPSVDGGNDQRVVPQRIRAHAFIAFGKMCLRDESLARTSINIFARELRQEREYSSPAVKSNALTILGDFCIRYTNLVDKFLPLMASCLQPFDNTSCLSDSESMLRRHAIIILSNLILQDYIKWKGVLFYRFLAATVDDDPQVANQAKMMLCGPLLSKQPTLFFNNFIDAVFVLNGCTAHPLYKNRNSRESLSINTDGLDNFRIPNVAKREEIYSLLIDYLSDEEKIGVTARLSKEILSAATEMQGEMRHAANEGVENHAKEDGGAFSVLSDCFQILISPKMQMLRSSNNSLSTEDDEVDNSTNVSTITNIQVTDGHSASQLSFAKGKLLSKISRKHLIEIVLPIVCNLKIILEKSRSPLLKNLMQYLVCIFRQFKKEVNETLASNPTLLQEIHYDTKRFEKNQKNETQLSQSQSLLDITVT